MSLGRKILQASAWYPPYGVGGTETYVEGLAQALTARGEAVSVLVPRPADAPERYEHRGVEVQTYPVNAEPATGESAGAPPANFSAFTALLSQNRGAIYNQHAWTRGLGPHHLRAAKDAGLSTVLTVHVASAFCLRGTMLLFGEAACDGRVDIQRCAACWAQSRGAPRLAAEAVSRLPSLPAIGQGRLATAVRARAIARSKLADVRGLAADADHIVAVCQWLYDALLLNGIDPAKLTLSRQGLAPGAAPTPSPAADQRLRLVYLGRWYPGKGIEVIVRALRQIPDAPVRLTIHGFAAGAEEEAYRQDVTALAAGDSRIEILPPVPPAEVAARLTQFDAMLVPSQVLETGPMVVLEAQAAGLFVIGSRLGGIAELVRDGDDGLLVRHDDPAAWSRAILAVCERSRPLAKSRPVRTSAEVADDMIAVYAALSPREADALRV